MQYTIDAKGTIYVHWSDGVLSTELRIGKVGGIGGQDWTFCPSGYCRFLNAAEEAEIDQIVADWKAEQRRIYRVPEAASAPIAAHAVTDVTSTTGTLLWTGYGPSDHTD